MEAARHTQVSRAALALALRPLFCQNRQQWLQNPRSLLKKQLGDFDKSWA
jgi:hypothetical protein